MISLIPVLLFLPFIHGSSRIDPLVDTKYGLIRGLRSDDGQYSMFLGIPYGLVDELNPFGSSIQYPGFNDTYEAYDDSVVCPQMAENTAIGSLQCLHLNIYVPNTATSKNRLPVMVWIHGGGFVQGSGNRKLYSPEYLVRFDVIVVAFNYRLGPYGFLCLDTPEIPGNQGLKDQLLALRWINENIESFGGDVKQITVFGESAGSISIDLHLLSNQEKLFDKAIMQSGTAMLPGLIGESDTGIPLILAERLGYETANFEEAVSFLSGQNPHLVVAAAFELGVSMMHTKLCIEKDFEGVEKFIHDYPINIRSTKIRNIPILHGYNNNEMLSHFTNTHQYFENFSFKKMFNSDITFIDNDVTDIVRHFYIGDEAIGENVVEELTKFASDFTFYSPAERSLKKYINDGAKTIYYYVFSYDGGRNYNKVLNNVTGEGAAHADELGYLFVSDVFTDQPIAEDQLVIDRFTTMWTNFAKHGEPTPAISELLPINWIPVTETTRPYLNIDSDLSLQSRPFHDRMAFWELFYKLIQNNLEYRKKTEF